LKQLVKHQTGGGSKSSLALKGLQKVAFNALLRGAHDFSEIDFHVIGLAEEWKSFVKALGSPSLKDN